MILYLVLFYFYFLYVTASFVFIFRNRKAGLKTYSELATSILPQSEVLFVSLRMS